MLNDDEVLKIVNAELDQIYSESNTSVPDLHKSLDYYLGNPNGKEMEGKSQITSTDVADAIEWIMPQIMESFTQNNQIVIFDAVHKEDEKQANLESQYVYEVLMKQNEGFILLHQFIKDALIQRNGMLKVYYENDAKEWFSEYTGISEQELNVIASYPDAEIVEYEERIDNEQAMIQQAQYEQMASQQPGMPPPQPPMVYDVKIKFTSNNGRVVIDVVPGEEFRVNSDHSSISLEKARFTAHIVEKTLSELRAEGYSDTILEKLPRSSDSIDSSSAYRFLAQSENVEYDYTSEDATLKKVEIAENYLLIDYNEDGIAELCKVTTAGEDNNMLYVLSVEEIEESPWVATTAIMMSHKFQGLSIYDRLKEIQDQKTALSRNMFDNVYFQNNQRYAVVEGQVNEDDMLYSRQNGIVRVRRPDSIFPLITPQLSPDSYSLMDYLDKVKAGRSGVSAEGSTAPQDIGDRVGSQGVERLMNSKEALVGLIIRVVAETGIKPLCIKIRNLSTRHVDSISDFRFKGEWQKIQPSNWISRTQCTVRVGTGTGDKQQKLSALTFLMDIQEKIQNMPDQVLAGQQEMYNTIDHFCHASGLNGADGYFIDPSSQEGQQAQQKADQKSQEDEQMNKQLNIQSVQAQVGLAQAELQKAKAQESSVQARAQTDMAKNQLQLQKQAHEAEINNMQARIDQLELAANTLGKSAELQFKYDDMENRTALELTRIEEQKEQQENDNYAENKQTVSE